tara:strand:- start:7352 stop:8257 length:906 start_codon:yes stop_codon:yes gene_type:complete
MTLEDIEQGLAKLGFKNLKRDSGRTVSILTDENRIKVLEKVAASMKDLGAKYDPDKGSSSIGAVVVDGYTIKARPASKQGKKSAGLDNEDAMIDGIKTFTKGGPITVKITDGKKSYTYKNVVDVEEVGRDTSNRKKADVRLVLKDGTKIPVSIKKDNAEMWESADSYWAPTAKKIVDKLESEGKVVITKKGSVNFLTPNLGIKATSKEKKAVVFGSDLLGNGFVVVRTFRSSDFTLSKDGDILEVKATKIIDKMTDLKGPSDIFFLIRNDSSRKGSKIRPGLRVLAVSGTRINKNVLQVTR